MWSGCMRGEFRQRSAFLILGQFLSWLAFAFASPLNRDCFAVRYKGFDWLMRDADRFIQWVNTHEGVEWMPFGDMATEFLEGRIEGYKVEGGADI